jgi:LPS export ABC transporter protein LptC
MSINVFFFLILALLVGMFSYFKPSNDMPITEKKVAQFEMDDFILYEISPQQINHFFTGAHGSKFPDYYEATNAKLTSNKRGMIESIRADRVLYKEDVIDLKGNVHYEREDGLEFYSQEGIYDQKNSYVKTSDAFRISKNQNTIYGIQLYYDLELDTVDANQITGIYQLN